MSGQRNSLLVKGVVFSVLLGLSSVSKAETLNLVDYRSYGGFTYYSSLTELFETRERGEILSFWVKLTTTSRFDGSKTISIRDFPISRLRAIKKSLRRMDNKRSAEYFRIGCDFPSWAVRFKNRTQSVTNLCRQLNVDQSEPPEQLTDVLSELRNLSSEVWNLPDATYSLTGD